MAFETREEVFERVISMERPRCPHCSKEMNIWEIPPIDFSDGLGWGVPYLFVCFNDECPLFKNSWEDIMENYGRTASYRCLSYPGTDKFDCMPVWGPQGGQGQIIDAQVVEEQAKLKEKTKKGLAVIAESKASGSEKPILELLLDAGQSGTVRAEAADALAECGGLDVIDALQNAKFGNAVLVKKTETAVSRIHERNFTRECPFCAEIVKIKANICKHCGSDIAGK